MRRLKLVYYGTLLSIALLVGFQLYLNFSEPVFDSVHVDQVNAVRERLERNEGGYRFVVAGSVNNSIRVFRDQFIPRINQRPVNFLISAGNAVSSGQEESYRSIYSIFERLEMPYLLTYAENEDSAFGSYRFYNHFGPHFYSFVAGDALFAFLDLTGKTPLSWQLDWLARELANSDTSQRFIFTGASLFPPQSELAFLEPEPALGPSQRETLTELFSRYEVDAVFSGDVSVYHHREVDGVDYIVSGGAGGLIVDDENSFHHFVEVSVTDGAVDVRPVSVEVSESGWVNTLDSIWSVIYSFFYVSYARFLTILAVLLLVGLKLHEMLFVEKNYYSRFEVDDAEERHKRKRVAFFSNNYFPFVSGVTLSVDRLCQGLKEQGHRLLLVVPRYGKGEEANVGVLRVRTLLSFGARRQFRLANVLSWRAVRGVREFRPDIIHVHHPFWLGSLGLFLGRRLGVPVVYTYHTRLEQYAHYVPLPGPVFRNFVSHFMVKRFCNKCSGVIVPTTSVDEYLRAIGVRTPILVQPTGIDAGRFQEPAEAKRAQLRERWGLRNEDRIMITVSRLAREKNLDFLLDAARRTVEDAAVPVKLLVVGDGDRAEHLRRRVAEMGLEDRIILTGQVAPEEVPAYYQLADLFVFSSKSETQGMVLLEAMAAGLPVVALRSSGIDDVIDQGQNGFKCNEDQWSHRAVELLTDDNKRAGFSQAARKLAQQHDTGHFAECVNGFYAQLLAERRMQGAR